MNNFEENWYENIGQISYQFIDNSALYSYKTSLNKHKLEEGDANLELTYAANKLSLDYGIAITRQSLSVNDIYPGITSVSPLLFLIKINLSSIDIKTREDFNKVFNKEDTLDIEQKEKLKQVDKILKQPYKTSEMIKTEKSSLGIKFLSNVSEPVEEIPQRLINATKTYVTNQNKTLEGVWNNIASKINFDNLKSFVLSNLIKLSNGEINDVECFATDLTNELLCAKLTSPTNIKENNNSPKLNLDLSGYLDFLTFNFFEILEKTIENIAKELIKYYVDKLIHEYIKLLDKDLNINRFIHPCNDDKDKFNTDQQRRISLYEAIDLNNKDFKDTFENDIIAKNMNLGYTDYLKCVDLVLNELTPRELNGLYNSVVTGEAIDKIKDIFKYITGESSDNDQDYIDLFANYKQYTNTLSFEETNKYLPILNCNHLSVLEIKEQRLQDLGYDQQLIDNFINSQKNTVKTTSKIICDFLQRKTIKIISEEKINNSDIVKKTINKNIDNIFNSLEKNIQQSNNQILKRLFKTNGDLTIAAFYLYKDNIYKPPLVPTKINNFFNEQIKQDDQSIGDFYTNFINSNNDESNNFFEKYLKNQQYFKINKYIPTKTFNRFEYNSEPQNEQNNIVQFNNKIVANNTEIITNNDQFELLSDFIDNKLIGLPNNYIASIKDNLKSEIEIWNDYYSFLNDNFKLAINSNKQYYILSDFFIEEIIQEIKNIKNTNKFKFIDINLFNFDEIKQSLKIKFETI